MTFLLILGSVGALLLLVSLIFGELIDGLFDSFDALESDYFSTAVLSTFLVVFGFGSAAIISIGWPVWLACVISLVFAVGWCWVAARLTRAAMNMYTDAPIRAADYKGKEGTIVSPVPICEIENCLIGHGYGEVLIEHSGQRIKVKAVIHADDPKKPLPRGTRVVVTEVLSPTAVRVESAEKFWGSLPLPNEQELPR